MKPGNWRVRLFVVIPAAKLEVERGFARRRQVESGKEYGRGKVSQNFDTPIQDKGRAADALTALLDEPVHPALVALLNEPGDMSWLLG